VIRAWHHGRSALFVAWLYLEPPVTRIITACWHEIDGARHGQNHVRAMK
jgi:hypothetical protein